MSRLKLSWPASPTQKPTLGRPPCRTRSFVAPPPRAGPPRDRPGPRPFDHPLARRCRMGAGSSTCNDPTPDPSASRTVRAPKTGSHLALHPMARWRQVNGLTGGVGSNPGAPGAPRCAAPPGSPAVTTPARPCARRYPAARRKPWHEAGGSKVWTRCLSPWRRADVRAPRAGRPTPPAVAPRARAGPTAGGPRVALWRRSRG